jgi:hypothetical protein
LVRRARWRSERRIRVPGRVRRETRILPAGTAVGRGGLVTRATGAAIPLEACQLSGRASPLTTPHRGPRVSSHLQALALEKEVLTSMTVLGGDELRRGAQASSRDAAFEER